MFGKRSATANLSLLLVDANLANIRATHEALKASPSPFAVDAATDTRAALEKLRARRYDCLLIASRILDAPGPPLREVVKMAGPQAALVVLCPAHRPELPADLTNLERVTFLDSEALRSPGLAEKISECLEVTRAVADGQVDALLLPGPGTTSPMLAPGTDSVYRVLVETLQEGLVTVDPQGDIVFTNRRAGEILGCDADSLLGQNILALAYGEQRPLLRAQIDEALSGATPRCELTLAYRGSTPVHVLASLILIGYAAKSPTAVCLALTDLTEEKRLRDELQRLAITDALTGLHNRRYLTESLDSECRRSRRYKRHLSCLMIDVDNLKLCNDLYGHLAGDGLLRRVAALIKDSVRDTDVIVRYGGDEFCVLLPETPHHEAMLVADRLRSAIATESLVFGQRRLSFTVSIGVYTPKPEEDLQADMLVGGADGALRAAKAAKNRVCGKTSAIDTE